eukprot:4917928-Amphidinium_carterae.1
MPPILFGNIWLPSLTESCIEWRLQNRNCGFLPLENTFDADNIEKCGPSSFAPARTDEQHEYKSVVKSGDSVSIAAFNPV